jgi:nucleoid-associated protein YgaU
MPSILDRIFGRKTEEKKVETKAQETSQKVAEEAARLRREALEKERQANEAARLAGIEAEKKRLAAIEAAKQAGTSVQAAVEKVTAQAAAVVGTRTYVVQSGDSLSKIAKALLGDAKRWPEIYEANKALIGDNPNLIHPGQKLVIP